VALSTAPGYCPSPEESYIDAVESGAEELELHLRTLERHLLDDDPEPNATALMQTEAGLAKHAVDALRQLQAPEHLAVFETELHAALDRVDEGLVSLGRALETREQSDFITAFQQLTEGKEMLTGAMATLS
jgi:hypothetical protein